METLHYKIKEQSFLARVAAYKLGAKNVAFVVGKTIHLHDVSKEYFLNDAAWLRHELCHIRQFKEHGYFGFIFKYLWESWRKGYHDNKYEVEARQAEKFMLPSEPDRK